MEQPSTSIGDRIARLRKGAGLTQAGLAARCHYSRSHIAQAEAGHRPATPAFAAAVAAALRVPVARVYGQPYNVADAIHGSLQAIRDALAYVDIPPDLDAPPRSLEELETVVTDVAGALSRARHVTAASLLPAVLEELTSHVLDSDDERAWRLLHRAQTSTLRLARKLGYADLAEYVAERARSSATATGDPHLQTMLVQRRTLIMMDRAQWRPAITALNAAARQVDMSRPDAVEVEGAIRLRQAVIAARAGAPGDAWDYYAHAQAIDEEGTRREQQGLSVVRGSHGTTFTSGNVSVHGAAVGVELRDLDAAVRNDPPERVLAGLIPERRAHHAIDMSRVYIEAERPNDAVSRLEQAVTAAPELARYHPQVRAVMGILVDRHRALPPRLHRLQRQIGLTA